MNGLMIMCMKLEHLFFLDNVSFPCPLRKLPEAFGLNASKSWYRHYFNTEENLDYVGPIPEVYGVNEMSEVEKREFPARYECQKEAAFENRRVLEAYFCRAQWGLRLIFHQAKSTWTRTEEDSKS